MPDVLTCPCGKAVNPSTKHFHRPDCPLNARPLIERLRLAISDPGSVLPREHPEDKSQPSETITSWSARAVAAVLTAEGFNPEGKNGRGWMYLDSAPGGDSLPSGNLRCQSRAVDADGAVTRCGLRAAHGMDARPCEWVPEEDDRG